MSDLFLDYIAKTLVREGGERYTNDLADRGGPTKWGINEATARAAGYPSDMRSLTREQAIAIYRAMFWDQPGFGQIAALSPPVGAVLLDLGVNCGPSWPSKWLQRALNVCNNGEALWPALVVDGQAGLATRSALSRLLALRGADGVRVLCALIRGFAAVRYVEIAEADPSQERFAYGWLANRAFPAEGAA